MKRHMDHTKPVKFLVQKNVRMELHHASKTFRAAPVARSQPVEFGFHKTLITFKALMTPNHEILIG